MHRLLKTFVLPALVGVVGSLATVFAQAPPQPTRAIVNVTGQLYRAQNNDYNTVFLVTPDGIIMTDPIDADFSRWLKAELATRFKVPVRYVLYTHNHWDHASGGAIWADTAQFVGHANLRAALALPAGNPPLPPADSKSDANGDGLISAAEATGGTKERFAAFDFNHDNLISGAELARGSLNDVYPPTITFQDSHTIVLGGKAVRMISLGPAHSSDSALIYFPEERAIFSADILQVRRLPGGVGPSVGAWIDAYKTMLALDFEHALAGHLLAGTKKDVQDLHQYLQDLSTGVAAGIAAGRTLPEIQKTLTLDAYKGFARWDTLRTGHIASVYPTTKGTR